MKTKIMLLSISALDKKGCICRTHRFNTNTEFDVIYSVRDFLSIFDHEKDRHRSSESGDEVEHVVRDSSNPFKEKNIRKESTKQTKISI